jgi:hypothetical protein
VTPDSKVVSNSYVITAVPENPAQGQIASRQVTSETQKKTQNIKASGHNKTAGSVGAGRLTFYNGSVSSFTVAAGTVFTAENGMKIITNEPAVIPGSPGSTKGSVTISARAGSAGTAGNIAANMIHGTCCTTAGFITVYNLTAFGGGVDPKDYNYVTQKDYDTAKDALAQQLSKQANDNLNGQVKPTEQLAGNPSCPIEHNASNKVGDQGVAVDALDVTVSITCKATVYDKTAMNTLILSKLQTKAEQDLGAGYAIKGEPIIHSTVQKIGDKNDVSLLVDARGLWVYQFSSDFKTTLAQKLAGKTVREAETLAKAEKGVASVKIDYNNGTQQLPTDVSQIAVVVVDVPALKDTPTPGTTPTPVQTVPGNATPTAQQGKE